MGDSTGRLEAPRRPKDRLSPERWLQPSNAQPVLARQPLARVAGNPALQAARVATGERRWPWPGRGSPFSALSMSSLAMTAALSENTDPWTSKQRMSSSMLAMVSQVTDQLRPRATWYSSLSTWRLSTMALMATWKEACDGRTSLREAKRTVASRAPERVGFAAREASRSLVGLRGAAREHGSGRGREGGGRGEAGLAGATCASSQAKTGREGGLPLTLKSAEQQPPANQRAPVALARSSPVGRPATQGGKWVL